MKILFKNIYPNQFKGMNFLFTLYLILIFFILNQTNIFSQGIEKDLEQYLSLYQKNKNVPSISAGVSIKGNILWLGAQGYSDVENLVPASPKTVYRIASISKSITAVAVMQLVEQGKINLDEDIRKYIPYFPKKKWKFTPRQLLSHTSGIRNYRAGEFESKTYFNSTKEAVSLLLNDPLQFEPGSKYLYTTLGYNLLAAIIEKASGLSYKYYVKTKILDPIEMFSTYFEVPKEIIPNRARSYVRNDFRKLENVPFSDLSIKYSGGGIISTTEDLLKFANGLLSGNLIKPATLDLMLKPFLLKNGDSLDYGLGFNLWKDEKGKFCFGHSGAGNGCVSILAIYPKDSIAVVDLINLRDRNLETPAFELASIVLDHSYKIPMISSADKMMEITFEIGIDSAINKYKSISIDSSITYDISESELNLFGNDLLNLNMIPDALTFYKFFTKQFPSSSKAFIGLGKAYLMDGNKGLALRYLRKALILDPLDIYASDMIKKIESGNI